MQRFPAALVFCLLLVSAAAQERLILDSADIQLRSIPAERISRYRAEKAFQYEKESEGTRSDWRRFWDWVSEKMNRWFGIEGAGLGYLFFAAAFVILIICILNLRGLNRTGFFARNSAGGGTRHESVEENLHEISFDEEIQHAIHSKNFRQAVRLLYLQTLKTLADKGFIKWQINKTNAVYLNELDGSGFRQSFGDLTLQFENHWYGAAPIGEKEFTAVADRFQFFKRELSQA